MQRHQRCEQYQRPLGNGLVLRAEVSPCVFMSEGYPLQVGVKLCRLPDESLGIAFVTDRTKNAQSYTDADVERLLDGIRTVPCRDCNDPAFDPLTVDTNRNGFCESCFIAKLNAKFAIAEAAEREALAERDIKARAAGMKVRVSAWIHPESGGDDYQMDWYLNALPTLKHIESMIRREGSMVVDDYTIIEL